MSQQPATVLEEASPNLFAQALKGLLDDTGLYSREQWATMLGVSPPAISQWVNNHTLPRADLLRMIIDIATESDGVPPDVLKRFWEVAAQPAAEVVPNPHRVGNSISDYIVAPVFAAFETTLRNLPGPTQEEVLLAAAAMSRLMRPGGRREARWNDFRTVCDFLHEHAAEFPLIEPIRV